MFSAMKSLKSSNIFVLFLTQCFVTETDNTAHSHHHFNTVNQTKYITKQIHVSGINEKNNIEQKFALYITSDFTEYKQCLNRLYMFEI